MTVREESSPFFKLEPNQRAHLEVRTAASVLIGVANAFAR